MVLVPDWFQSEEQSFVLRVGCDREGEDLLPLLRSQDEDVHHFREIPDVRRVEVYRFPEGVPETMKEEFMEEFVGNDMACFLCWDIEWKSDGMCHRVPRDERPDRRVARICFCGEVLNGEEFACESEECFLLGLPYFRDFIGVSSQCFGMLGVGRFNSCSHLFLVSRECERGAK